MNTSEPSKGTAKPKLTRTLTFRLVVIFTALLTVVALLLALLTSTALTRFLLRDLDEDLVSSGKAVASDYLRQRIFPAPGRDIAEDGDFSLSDYYVYIDLDRDWESVIAETQRFGPRGGGTGDSDAGSDASDTQNSSPDTLQDSPGDENSANESIEQHTEMTHNVRAALASVYGAPANVRSLEETVGSTPRTVAGTKGKDWRAIVLAVTAPHSQEEIGSVVIATPLEPRMNIISRINWALAGITVGAIATGALLTLVLVRRNMAPLRKIERATHAIAEGNLSSRVPAGPEGSEVGMLSDSINLMLAQIEHSFDIKTESEAKMRRFISDASHELRTPLATVRGYAELYRLGGVPADRMPQTMTRVESEAIRMGALVEDLLQLARLDEGRGIELADVDLLAIARDAIADLEVRGDGRPGTVIGIDAGTPEPVTVRADQNKVTQVIANLLTNVLTHTPAGTPVEIALGTDPATRSAIVEVRDHGPGVPDSQRGKIFERFFRTDSSRSRTSGGSGLGLSIVTSVMGAHGGTAEALETDGGGLTVRLVFPIDGPQAAQTCEDDADQAA